MIWNDGNGTLQRPGTSRKNPGDLPAVVVEHTVKCVKRHGGNRTLSESRFCTTQMWRENVRYWAWRGPDSLWARVRHGRRKLESRRYDKITDYVGDRVQYSS